MKKIGFLICAMLLWAGCNNQTASHKTSPTAQEQIAAVTGATVEQSEGIYQVVVDGGILFKNIMADERLDNYNDTDCKGYWIQTPNVDEVRLYLNPDMTVYEICYRNECVYQDGEVVKKLYDAASGEYITLTEFNQIEMGMTYAKVKSIVGGDGSLLSAVDLGLGRQYKTEMYQWWGYNGNGSNAIVTFQGGEVTVITQFGLE